jgi:hypothetical protein
MPLRTLKSKRGQHRGAVAGNPWCSWIGHEHESADAQALGSGLHERFETIDRRSKIAVPQFENLS